MPSWSIPSFSGKCSVLLASLQLKLLRGLCDFWNLWRGINSIVFTSGQVSRNVFKPCTRHVWQQHFFLSLNAVPEYQSASILKCHKHRTTHRAWYNSYSCKLKQQQNLLWCKIQCYHTFNCLSFNASLLFHTIQIDIPIACAQMSGGNIYFFWTVSLKLSFYSSIHLLLPQHPKKKKKNTKVKEALQRLFCLSLSFEAEWTMFQPFLTDVCLTCSWISPLSEIAAPLQAFYSNNSLLYPLKVFRNV